MRQIFLTAYHHWRSNPRELIFFKTPLFTTICLSHVSQSWRQIALSIPHLWSCISIHIDPPSNDDQSRPKWHAVLRARTTACLARSKNAYLYIDIVVPNGSFNSIIQLLLPHANRWHTLGVEAQACTHILLNRTSDFRSLRRIYIQVLKRQKRSHGRSVASVHGLKLYQPAPLLETTIVEHDESWTRGRELNISNVELENLETWIGNPREGPDDIKALMARAKKIENLVLVFNEEISQRHMRPPNPTFRPRYDHDAVLPIDSLALITPGYVTNLGIGTILPPRDQIPFLRRLTVRECRYDYGLPFFGIIKYLTEDPKYDTLTHFTFKGHKRHSALEALFLILPDTIAYLELELNVGDRDMDVDILNGMAKYTANYARPPLFPRLQHVIIQQNNCTIPNFLPFLLPRLGSVSSSGHVYKDEKDTTLRSMPLGKLRSAFFHYITPFSKRQDSLPPPIRRLPDDDMDHAMRIYELGLMLRVQIDEEIIIGKYDSKAELHFNDLMDEMDWDEILRNEAMPFKYRNKVW